MKPLTLSFVVALALTACSYRTQKLDEQSTGALSGALGFSRLQASVLGPKCASCHDHATDFDTYDHTRRLVDRIPARIQSTDPGFMMPKPGAAALTVDEKRALLDWIAAGAPEFAGQTPAPPPEEEPVVPGLNFRYVKKMVLQPKCLACHRHAEDFDTYANTKKLAVEMKRRIHLVNDEEQMPPEGKPQLTAEEAALLDAWLDAGAPEDGGPLPAPQPQPAPQPEPQPAPQPEPQPQPAPQPEPQPAPQPQPLPPRVTFSVVQVQVLGPKCAGCHHHKRSNDFTTYELTKPMLSEIKTRVHSMGTDEQMPPEGKPQLTEEELKLLDAWLDDGAPEL